MVFPWPTDLDVISALAYQSSAKACAGEACGIGGARVMVGASHKWYICSGSWVGFVMENVRQIIGSVLLMSSESESICCSFCFFPTPHDSVLLMLWERNERLRQDLTQLGKRLLTHSLSFSHRRNHTRRNMALAPDLCRHQGWVTWWKSDWSDCSSSPPHRVHTILFFFFFRSSGVLELVF